MNEPTAPTASLAAAVIAMLGPLAGEWAIIVFAALAGSLWPLSGQTQLSRLAGASLVVRLVVTSAVFTGVIAWAFEHHWGIPARLALSPVAFCIAAIGEGWRTIFDGLGRALSSIRIGGAK